MIQGPGISTRVAYTHRDYRKARRMASRRIKTLKFRHDMCRKYDVSMREYLTRLRQWRLLRRDVEQIKRRFEDAGRYDELEDFLAAKAAARIENKKRYAEERLKKKAADQFAAFIGPPVD